MCAFGLDLGGRNYAGGGGGLEARHLLVCTEPLVHLDDVRAVDADEVLDPRESHLWADPQDALHGRLEGLAGPDEQVGDTFHVVHEGDGVRADVLFEDAQLIGSGHGVPVQSVREPAERRGCRDDY
ncbi:hypothetical protein PL81_38420 [Streptomyces sp. RSD-27]|nr:hypothetical protein PL81_38420 [Streptomyces sp. RSD-27]